MFLLKLDLGQIFKAGEVRLNPLEKAEEKKKKEEQKLPSQGTDTVGKKREAPPRPQTPLQRVKGSLVGVSSENADAVAQSVLDETAGLITKLPKGSRVEIRSAGTTVRSSERSVEKGAFDSSAHRELLEGLGLDFDFGYYFYSKEDQERGLLQAITALSNVNPISTMAALMGIMGSLTTPEGISLATSLLQGVKSEAELYVKQLIRADKTGDAKVAAGTLAAIAQRSDLSGVSSSSEGSRPQTELVETTTQEVERVEIVKVDVDQDTGEEVETSLGFKEVVVREHHHVSAVDFARERGQDVIQDAFHDFTSLASETGSIHDERELTLKELYALENELRENTSLVSGNEAELPSINAELKRADTPQEAVKFARLQRDLEQTPDNRAALRSEIGNKRNIQA